MRIDLNIVSYNRPDCIGILLASLLRQKCAGYEIGNVHLFQDGPYAVRHDEDARCISECIKQFQQTFPEGQVFAAAENIGINGNYKAVWECMASSDADACIVFEDDLELSPQYLNVMAKLLMHAQGNPNVGLVSALGALGVPLELQENRLKALVPMGRVWGLPRVGWGVTREVIAEMLPLKRMYFDLTERVGFKDNEDLIPGHEVARLLMRFMTDMAAYQGPNCVAVDTLYDVAGIALNRVNLTTYANYARLTGGTGLHFTPELHLKRGYAGSVMTDEVPSEFAWYEPEMMLDVVSLIRRYYANNNMLFCSGTFGCDLPTPHLEEAHIVKYLYDQILGWELTYHDMICLSMMTMAPRDEIGIPEERVRNILAADYDDSFGLLNTGRRKQRNYSFPYAIQN